jgi:3-phosphoshikimate 1-carboxyvinyltransferase
MTIQLLKSKIKERSKIVITGSKSESNRLLLLQALYPELQVGNVSDSDDSLVMQEALASNENTIDVHHAGTAMRFLTAYFASKKGRELVLTGSSRMKERPIAVLVDALQQLGADISYTETNGCPPLKIRGKTLLKDKVTLKANVSSQYISALLLVASRLEHGLELTLEGDITSIPYINMTLDLLNQIGVETTFNNQVIVVHPKIDALKTKYLTVESDWSSASYFYSMIALSPENTQIELTSYKAKSLQGDAVLAKLYTSFGVETIFENGVIRIKKTGVVSSDSIVFDLNNSPDIAQTIAVTCLGLGIACHLTGLHTLKIKETDRLVALQNELSKLGGTIDISEDSLTLYKTPNLNKNVSIATYNDHRMAMAFAPLALQVPITIEDYMVVSKSYPTFWEDLQTLGFNFLK